MLATPHSVRLRMIICFPFPLVCPLQPTRFGSTTGVNRHRRQINQSEHSNVTLLLRSTADQAWHSAESDAARLTSQTLVTFTLAFVHSYVLILSDPGGLTLSPGNTVSKICRGNFILAPWISMCLISYAPAVLGQVYTCSQPVARSWSL
jgi:hypothetical protein